MIFGEIRSQTALSGTARKWWSTHTTTHTRLAYNIEVGVIVAPPALLFASFVHTAPAPPTPQNNPHVIPLLVEYVITSACAPASNGDKMTHLVDTYCGSGLFCLAGSSSFTTAIGIEVNDLAIEEAKMNAELNGIDNAKFICASAEKIFAELEEYPNDNTVVVIDPPRKGSSEEFLAQLVEFAPRRLVYMSCGPDTQARDTKFLLASGKYELREVVPFDLFPQTRHVESCAVFERID